MIMGQTPPKPSKPSSKPIIIIPLPGTYGASTRKRNHVTVYSPRLNLFCYIQISSESTVLDVKIGLQHKLSHPLEIRLFVNEVELEDFSLLSDCQVTERTLLRAEFSEDPSSLEVESMESMSKLDLSALSASCSLKDSLAHRSTTPDSTQSLPSKQPWEIDFSIYAIPDAGSLSTPSKKRKRPKQLNLIEEICDPLEEETGKRTEV